MIYITGDTHGSHDFAKLKRFASENKSLTKRDYMIIAGDFGGVWEEYTLKEDLKRFEDLPFTVLFVDGNHENFELLNSYPVKIWNGGKVHFVKPDIIHFMRGQVYEIDGKRFFTFGGATSIDKCYRIEGISWWAEETPCDEDVAEANANLENVNFQVDYVVTHSCDERALYYPPFSKKNYKFHPYPENYILSDFETRVNYKRWYFGHYHEDARLTDKKIALYHNIEIIE